jgi:hypothetical protein
VTQSLSAPRKIPYGYVSYGRETGYKVKARILRKKNNNSPAVLGLKNSGRYLRCPYPVSFSTLAGPRVAGPRSHLQIPVVCKHIFSNILIDVHKKYVKLNFLLIDDFSIFIWSLQTTTKNLSCK